MLFKFNSDVSAIDPEAPIDLALTWDVDAVLGTGPDEGEEYLLTPRARTYLATLNEADAT